MALLPQVPSNLIPLKVTQLPLAPVASEDSLMMIVYQGNNYQIRVGDLLSVAGVPTSRQVIAGTGMSGGGALASNVTLSIAQKGVTGALLEDTGVTAGVYGTATRIPVLTVDSTGRVTAANSIPVEVSGYVPETRQVIAGEGLTGGGTLNNNVTLAADLSNATPQTLDNAGSAGSATSVSRADHKHPAVDLSSGDQVDGVLGLMNGGTANSLVPDAGAIIWCGADGLYVGPVGEAGQVLVSSGTGEYTWGSAVIVTPQAANTFFAGPTSGDVADPLFRTMVNADLPDSGATPGSYGSALAIPVVTVNAKGVVTSITTTSFTGGLSYKGAWNAATNSPTLVSGVGTNGDYYVVSVAGSTNLDGITDWQIGDWALFNGVAWQKIDQSNSVSSVNGQVGAVVLDYADVGAPSTTGTGASGTWAIDISGNAATATSAGSATAATTADKVAHALTIGSGLTGTSFDGSAAITITNAAPDQTVVLNNGTGISVTGTYPNFTVTNTAPSSGGTVTSVSTAGTVNGLTLTGGPITSTGTVTLGGTLDLSSPPVIGGTTPNTITGSTINANTKVVSPDYYAQSVLGGNLRTSGGTSLLNWDGGGSGNVTVNGGLLFTASNKNANLSPTGTGTVTVNPATAGAINNMVVGGTTAAAGTFTDLRVNTSLSLNGSAGTSGQVLTSAGGGLPTWTTPTVGTVTSVGGTGTVSGLTLTGTVTTSGSLTLGGTLAVTPSNFSSQTANTFLAAPNGSAGTPTFRAIVAADVPTLNQNTTGTAAGLSTTLAISSGGTGQTTASAAFNALSPVTSTGDLIVGNGVNSSTRLAIGGNATVLTSNGTTASWAALPAGVSSFSAGTTGLTPSTGTTGAVTLAGTLNVANGGTGLTSLTANYVPYGNGTSAFSSSANFAYNGTYLRVGATTPLSGATNPITAFTGSTNGYVQTYILNGTAGASASADLVAYADNSTDAHGWADMGFTSSAYADTTYTVTGPNEAYLFGSAPSGSGKTGNLVYATDSTGTENVHQFYVGGFTQAKTAWKTKIDSTGLKAPQVNATNGLIVNSMTVSANYTVATGDSAFSIGPMTVASGVSVTVSSGSRWVVI